MTDMNFRYHKAVLTEGTEGYSREKSTHTGWKSVCIVIKYCYRGVCKLGKMHNKIGHKDSNVATDVASFVKAVGEKK